MSEWNDPNLLNGFAVVVVAIAVIVITLIFVKKLRNASPLGRMALRHGWQYDGSGRCEFSSARRSAYQWNAFFDEDDEENYRGTEFRANLAGMHAAKVHVMPRAIAHEAMAYAQRYAGRGVTFDATAANVPGLATVARIADIAMASESSPLVRANGMRVTLTLLADPFVRDCTLADAELARLYAVKSNSPQLVETWLAPALAGLLQRTARSHAGNVVVELTNNVLVLRIADLKLKTPREWELFLKAGEEMVKTLLQPSAPDFASAATA
jgi:hypothetical protein